MLYAHAVRLSSRRRAEPALDEELVARRARAAPDRGEPRDSCSCSTRTSASCSRASAPARRSKAWSRAARDRRSCSAPGSSRVPLPRPVRGRGPHRDAALRLRRRATSRPTRSCGPGSPPPSRTSCARRSPGCSRCSRRRCSRRRTPTALIDQARARGRARSRELIDDVLFLCELETGPRGRRRSGRRVALPVLEKVVAAAADSAERAGVRARAPRATRTLELPLRPRMLRVVAANLVENAIRYAGAGATLHARASSDGERRASC